MRTCIKHFFQVVHGNSCFCIAQAKKELATEGTKRKLEEISVEEPLPKLDICSTCKYEFDHNQNDGGEQDDPCEHQPGEHPGEFARIVISFDIES